MIRCASVFLALVLSWIPAAAAEISGVVTAVHDGDTLTLSTGDKVRVFGIDAPELAQKCLHGDVCVPCGERAREALLALTAGKSVVCVHRGKSYRRIVGECSVDGVAIGPWMLREGRAVSYNRYLRKADGPTYLDAQNEAMSGKRGIWAEIFIPMEDWRHHGARLACER